MEAYNVQRTYIEECIRLAWMYKVLCSSCGREDPEFQTGDRSGRSTKYNVQRTYTTSSLVVGLRNADRSPVVCWVWKNKIKMTIKGGQASNCPAGLG
ncbi:hypothetical protein ACRALDRAFT_2061255 [Sodiomyces alcalophilus JCM 7366]|uniref:uncharacterized protein n=1 Tax=Sodiomyces alcalophilus JCM 7366 TaxID=591952 RepID=UPI0039B69D48